MQQILMVVGAFMLLSLLTISVNKSIIDRTNATYESESVIASSTLAQALLQEVTLRAFDQNTRFAAVASPTGLTSVASLGKEGEVYPLFNDLDDYKGFTRYDTARIGIFRSSVDVQYANPSSPNDSSTTQTFYKKITVSVITKDSTKMSYPVTLSTVVTY